MANRGDVRAGSAYVALSTDDSKLRRGLDAAVNRLRGFAEQSREILERAGSAGRGLLAIGVGATGAIVAISKTFADAGDELARLQKRTGASALALSALSHAALGNGVSFEAMSKSLTLLQQAIGGGGSAVEAAFRQLGTSLDEIRSMSIDEAIGRIADELSRMTDAEARADVARTLFGRSASQMIDVLTGGAAALNDAAAEARRLGDAFDDKALAAAGRLDSAFDRLEATTKGLRNAIGEALEPALAPLLGTLSAAVERVGAWVDKNPELARSVLGLSLGVAALGATIVAAATAAAGGIGLVSVATTALASVMTALTGISGLLSGALGATAATATAAGVAATGAAAGTSAFAAASAALGVVLWPLGVGALLFAAALAIVGAALVAVTGLAVETTESLTDVETGFGNLFNSVRLNGQGLATWFGKFWSYLSEGWESLWFNAATQFDFFWTAITGLAGGFYDEVIAPIVDVFGPILEGIWEMVSTVFGWISEKLAGVWTALSDVLGLSAEHVLGSLDSVEEDQDDTTKNFSQRLRDRTEKFNAAVLEERRKRQELDRADPNDGRPGFAFDKNRAASGAIKIGNSVMSGLTNLLDSFLPNEARSRGDERDPFKESTPRFGGISREKPPDESGKSESKDGRSAAAERADPGVDVLGTFSATVASQLGFGTGLEERQTRAAEEAARNTRDIRDEIRRRGTAAIGALDESIRPEATRAMERAIAQTSAFSNGQPRFAALADAVDLEVSRVVDRFTATQEASAVRAPEIGPLFPTYMRSVVDALKKAVADMEARGDELPESAPLAAAARGRIESTVANVAGGADVALRTIEAPSRRPQVAQVRERETLGLTSQVLDELVRASIETARNTRRTVDVLEARGAGSFG